MPHIRQPFAYLALLISLCLPHAAALASDKAVVAYAGGSKETRFHDVHVLPDGSVLLAGTTGDLGWLPATAKRIELAGDLPKSAATGLIPLLLHCSADLATVRHAVTLPRDTAEDFRFIRSTSVPGEKTGHLVVSGTVKGQGKEIRAGYFIARLDGNFVDAAPTRLLWSRNIAGTGDIQRNQPWDVDAKGNVVYASGDPYSYDWLAVNALDAAGKDRLMPMWRTHWGRKADGSGVEFAGYAADAPKDITLTHSAIVLKIWGRGDFRSWSREDFLAKSSDGNGGTKQGKWPLDAMFDGYYNTETKKTEPVLDTKRGYYGYKFGGTPCAHVNAITIDRRTGELYIGGNNKSTLPGGNPDFEPWLVAMAPDGKLRWWQRLYSEEKGVSTPDQYADALAIDYRKVSTADPGAGRSLVVVARAHGNNVNNFWNGNDVKHPANPGHGFQDSFTGTHGNMHFSWIGRLTLDDGTLLNCTYFAEYSEGAKHQDDTFKNPLLSHWPHFKSGWPDLNTTRVEARGVKLDDKGRVYVVAQGRRVITTSNAFMEMPSPLRDKGSVGQWADFVRVYTPDLTTLEYSSILAGKWDWTTGEGGSKVDLQAVAVTEQGLITVGFAPGDKAGNTTGDPMPTANVPAWAAAKPSAPAGVVAHLPIE